GRPQHSSRRMEFFAQPARIRPWARMRMHRRLGPGGPPLWVIRSKYSGAVTGGTAPISATLLAPEVEPPLRPSVRSHALPPAYTAIDVRPSRAPPVSPPCSRLALKNGPAPALRPTLSSVPGAEQAGYRSSESRCFL